MVIAGAYEVITAIVYFRAGIGGEYWLYEAPRKISRSTLNISKPPSYPPPRDPASFNAGGATSAPPSRPPPRPATAPVASEASASSTSLASDAQAGLLHAGTSTTALLASAHDAAGVADALGASRVAAAAADETAAASSETSMQPAQPPRRPPVRPASRPAGLPALPTVPDEAAGAQLGRPAAAPASIATAWPLHRPPTSTA